MPVLLCLLLFCITDVVWVTELASGIKYRSIRNKPEEARKLIESCKDDLVLLFMGDTQYFFACERINTQCKLESEAFRRANSLDFSCGLSKSDAQLRNITDFIRHQLIKQCVEKESLFANHIQNQAIRNLIKEMHSKPAALIINGDLTDFGHLDQLEIFKKEWLNLPIPVLPGLGNHDYKNNVNDCVANHCANRMLYWLAKFGSEHGLKLDYQRKMESILKTVYTGSFAYMTPVSSESGIIQAYIIQLNNRPNYATQINAPFTQWTVTSSRNWLSRQLDSIRDPEARIFINLHNLDTQSDKMLIELLRNWIVKQGNSSSLQVYILHAHEHHRHRIVTKCATIKIPFIAVGSVPLNRLTAIRISPNKTTSEIFLLKVEKEHFMTVEKYTEFAFTSC